MSIKRTLEEMNKWPHCVFCKESYFELFKMRCSKCPKKNKLSAKDCEFYDPTEVPIEHRRKIDYE